jgi:hypothetical protein
MPPSTSISRALAENLTRRGLHVHLPREDDSEQFKVASAGGARCGISVDDEDTDVSEYLNIGAHCGEPGQWAAVVARILGADYADPAQYAHLHRGVTRAGAVGRDMKARGLNVTLQTYEDHDEFRVLADVVITNPAKPQRGEVSISDDGWLCWECYAAELPGGVADLADTIAATLTPTSGDA